MLMNLILFVGCGGSDSPYPMGLKINLSATVDEVTVSYRMNEGDDAPTEAVSLYGSGTAQEIAAYPGRTQSITLTGEEQIDEAVYNVDGHFMLFVISCWFYLIMKI